MYNTRRHHKIYLFTAMKSFLLIYLFVLVKCRRQTTQLEATYRLLNEQKMMVHIESSDVNYVLHTNGNFPEAIILNNKSKNLNENSTVKMIIHGFKEHNNVSWYRNMIKEYLRKDNYKVIAVDWSKWSKKTYIEAVASTYPVGIHIGNFIDEIIKNYNLNLQNVHIIGHSLGAHVAGFAGDRFYKKTDTKISRITGLDPAGPLFEIPINSNINWLDKGDARFVDNIHTDAGYFGFKHPTGHADFYPNGGLAIQPGCEITQFFSIQEYACSHKRSHAFFIESINSKYGLAKACASWHNFKVGKCNKNKGVPFGEEASINNSGVFYLETNSETPFLV